MVWLWMENAICHIRTAERLKTREFKAQIIGYLFESITFPVSAYVVSQNLQQKVFQGEITYLQIDCHSHLFAHFSRISDPAAHGQP